MNNSGNQILLKKVDTKLLFVQKIWINR